MYFFSRCILFGILRLRIIRLVVTILVMGLISDRVLASFTEKVIQEAKDSSLLILGDKGSGSGFVVSDEGYVVTNYHVVEGSKDFDCLFKIGNRAYLRPAKVVGVKVSADLAILKVERLPKVRPMRIGTYKPVSGQEVMAIGFPGYLFDAIGPLLKRLYANGDAKVSEKERDELDPATSVGNIIKIQKFSDEASNFNSITHDATISGGNSGGPLIDKTGNVIGINVGVGRTPGDIEVNYNFAIRSSELIQFARQQGVSLLTNPEMPSTTTTLADGSDRKLSLIKTLIISIALLVVVLFVLVLRKPRTVLVNSVSRLTGLAGRTNAPKVKRPRSPAVSNQPQGKLVTEDMRLRGRDRQGQSFEFVFNSQKISASGGRLIIGRNPNLCQLHLRHDSVSGQHATLTEKGGSIYVEDRNSGNGTSVNDRDLRLGETVPIKSGDHLVLGEVNLVFDQVKI